MKNRQKKDNENRNGLYSLLIVIAAVSGFLYGARTTGLFACQAPSRNTDQYLGFCNATNYGDYDHGALWFELEKTTKEAASQATVLFIGNSRMQFGLSTNEVEGWFESQALDYYLLGFSHDENHLFFGPLVRKIRPEAKIYILNVDNFFRNKLSGPANSVMYDQESRNRYRQKLYWRKIHERICGAIAVLCGNSNSFIRRRTNGAWVFKGADFLAQFDFSDQPVLFDGSVNRETLADYESAARSFLASIAADSKCVVLTNIPNSDTSAGTARALADRLGLPFVAPEMAGLSTFDGSHLDPESAARWSTVFVDALAPHLQQCLQGHAI